MNEDPSNLAEAPRPIDYASLISVGQDSPRTPETPETVSSGDIGGFALETERETPPFPIDWLPPVLSDLVSETGRVTQTPDALAAVVTLGFLSASIGGGLVVESAPGRITPANLFLLGIARSGTGKGRVFSIVGKPFLHAAKNAIDQWSATESPRIEAELEIASRRREKLAKEATAENDPGARLILSKQVQEAEHEKQQLEKARERQPCYSVGDITREKMAVTLASQPHEALASLSAEARGILGVLTGRYSKGGSSDEDIYLSGYSGDSYRVDRLNRPPVSLSTPRLSICWLAQPDAADRLLSDDRMTESGFLPRFLTCDVKAEPEDEPEYTPKMDPGIIAQWDLLVTALLDHYRNGDNAPHEVKMSSEGQKILREFGNSNKQRIRRGGDLTDITIYVSRWSENAIRLSLCLHAASHSGEAHTHPVSADTAQSAVRIVEWFIFQQLSLLSTSRTSRTTKKLSRLIGILSMKGGTETIRNLNKSHGFDRHEITKLAELYPTQLHVGMRQPPTPKGGRPSECVWLATEAQSGNRSKY